MGIPSARLDLRFGDKKLTLRGIAAVAEVVTATEYLHEYLLQQLQAETPVPLAEMTPSTPAIETNNAVDLQGVDASPANNTEATPDWQHIHSERHVYTETEQGQREHLRRRHGPAMEQLLRRLREHTLPIIDAPLLLPDGEYTHYSTEATLCAERSGRSLRHPYPVLDQGTLILTNKRSIYLGRQGQITLAHTCLLYLSRLRGALALQSDHEQHRHIFTMPWPLECATYLEQILEQVRIENPLHICPGQDELAEGVTIVVDEERMLV